MARQSTHDRLLASGRELIHRQGLAASGVAEITAAASVPKGSFYNHFASKEAFAVAALDDYWAAGGPIQAILAGPGAVPERVRRHFEAIGADMAAGGFVAGCLLGNMASEAGPVSEPMRRRAAELFAAWTGALAACLRAGQDAGEVGRAVPAETLARFLIAAWGGAVQRAKVERDDRAFAAFHTVLTTLIEP